MTSTRSRGNNAGPVRKQTGRKKPADNTVYMKPEGGPDGHKRTPKNIGDQYKGKPSYIPEEVLATCVVARKNRYHIKWVGLPSAANTWEPEEHLDGEQGRKAIDAFKAKCAAEIREVTFAFYLLPHALPLAMGFSSLALVFA